VSYDGANIIYGLYLRVARLNAAGATPVDTTGMFVSDGMVQLAFGLEFTDGDEIEKKNAAGKVCVAYKAPDRLKRLTISSLEICSPNPELYQLLAGGNLLTASTPTVRTVGYQAPAIGTDPMPNGISLEVWTAAVTADGSAPAVDPYSRWVFPRVYLRQSGDLTIANDGVGATFEGYGLQNSQWGNGPSNDWLFDSSRVYQWARTSTVPTADTSALAIPTQT